MASFRVPAELGLQMLAGDTKSEHARGACAFVASYNSGCYAIARLIPNEGHSRNEHASAPAALASCNGLLLQHTHARAMRDLVPIMLRCGSDELELPLGVQLDGPRHNHSTHLQHHTGKQLGAVAAAAAALRAHRHKLWDLKYKVHAACMTVLWVCS